MKGMKLVIRSKFLYYTELRARERERERVKKGYCRGAERRGVGGIKQRA
jgi:hypothetical protein